MLYCHAMHALACAVYLGCSASVTLSIQHSSAQLLPIKRRVYSTTRSGNDGRKRSHGGGGALANEAAVRV